MDWGSFRAEARARLGLAIDDGSVERLRRYHALVEEGSRVQNLTTVTDLEAFLATHLLDALSLVRALAAVPEKRLRRLVDVGSGAGIPAIPLAIVLAFAGHEPLPTSVPVPVPVPGDLQVAAVESTAKKARFIAAAARDLGLAPPRFTVLAARAEDLARRPDLRETFDCACARAVASLAVLAEVLLPFVRVGGIAVAYKTHEAAASEVPEASEAIAACGGSAAHVVDAGLGGLPGVSDHALVVVPKVAPTPPAVPRRAGIPEKRPLGAKGRPSG